MHQNGHLPHTTFSSWAVCKFEITITCRHTFQTFCYYRLNCDPWVRATYHHHVSKYWRPHPFVFLPPFSLMDVIKKQNRKMVHNKCILFSCLFNIYNSRVHTLGSLRWLSGGPDFPRAEWVSEQTRGIGCSLCPWPLAALASRPHWVQEARVVNSVKGLLIKPFDICAS